MRVEDQGDSPAKEVADTLGQDAFLRLLVAQIQNQDPMKPMEDRDFIAQLAQFSNLTQTQNLVRNQKTMLGATLLGEEYSLVTQNGDQIRGIVSSVRWKDEDVLITTDGGDQVYLGDVASFDHIEGETNDGE
ncbi:MAG: flagellar hook capping FlgD N-terminal domain-containing protein [Clostridia bacterium]